jgi:actin-related protein 8
MFQVLYLNAGQDFNIHFPYQRGDLYVHSGPGGSLTAVLANLETIWTWAIRYRLEIPLRDLRVSRFALFIRYFKGASGIEAVNAIQHSLAH